MQQNKRGESLIGIIVVVVIISISSIALFRIFEQWNKIDIEYKIKNYINILSFNSYKIVEKLNLNSINENQTFYIEKTSSNIKIYTWSLNEKYKYINELWELIQDVNNYKWLIFTRNCAIEKKSVNWNTINCEIKQFIKK